MVVVSKVRHQLELWGGMLKPFCGITLAESLPLLLRFGESLILRINEMPYIVFVNHEEKKLIVAAAAAAVVVVVTRMMMFDANGGGENKDDGDCFIERENINCNFIDERAL
ncbi:hypothetical protein PoB_001156000 [Plakobranchus ocellatus]|uniref:Uncharacterized protein n=1 Tax=Plakobranchus ocellatus TaxID=259542 RepID=A0AAV3YPI1_9GAST|nr:hypothetical protein PoB_001156000 [Plakobranchus ocellatus]